MKMYRFFSLVVKVVLVSFIIVGCSLPARLTGRPEGLARLERRHGKLSPGEIVELDGQLLIEFEALLERLDDKRIVYVGETHNEMDHHEVQLEILRGLYGRDPRLVIGMEMFERPFQGVLDRWIDGAIDQRTFLRESEWFSRWKFDFSYYERILSFARKNKIKILALNAPREVVDKVGDFGIKALSREEKALIAAIDTSDPRHRRYIRKVFDAHEKTSGGSFERFYEAQCVWDDTMAETISDFVTSRDGEDKKIIVFSGSGHIVHKFGIPERAFRRTGLPYATILPSRLKKIPKKLYDEKEPSLVIADFLWLTEGSLLKKARLGVVAENSLAPEKGVVIRTVVKGSSADKAGIQPGDTIVAIDEGTIDDMVDLRLALSEKEPGTVSRVIFFRDDVREEAEVTFIKSGFH